MPSDDEEDDEVGGTQLLPLHYQQPPTSPGSPAKPARATRASPHKPTRLSDVWDEREELFDIGEESDEEDEPPRSRADVPPPVPPKIVVSREE